MAFCIIVEKGDEQEDSLWRICICTSEDKMRILESCHEGLAGNGMMKNTIPLICVYVCVCVSGVVARGGRGAIVPPPAGLKNRGATEHKGRQQLKVCNN